LKGRCKSSSRKMPARSSKQAVVSKQQQASKQRQLCHGNGNHRGQLIHPLTHTISETEIQRQQTAFRFIRCGCGCFKTCCGKQRKPTFGGNILQMMTLSPLITRKKKEANKRRGLAARNNTANQFCLKATPYGGPPYRALLHPPWEKSRILELS